MSIMLIIWVLLILGILFLIDATILLLFVEPKTRDRWRSKSGIIGALVRWFY